MHKSEARARGRKVRREMSLQERAEASRLIAMHCRGALNWTRYRRLQTFLPIVRLGEVDTWELVRWLLEVWPEIQVYVPRLEAGKMVQVAITSQTRFRPSVLGIPEPVDGRVAAEDEQFDLVLVPLLAFDHDGNRVGYGGGYYDRLLAAQPGAQRVGLGYAGCVVAEGIVAEPHDVPLDAVVTETEVLATTHKNRPEAGS
jgi:5-formyltetrahydrofolate cyclo-ligase